MADPNVRFVVTTVVTTVVALAAPVAVFARQANEPRPTNAAAEKPAMTGAAASRPAASRPAASQPAATQPSVRAEVDAIIKGLGDPDAAVRARGTVRAKNLAGPAAQYVEQALNRDDLGEEARAALKAALPLLQYRAGKDAEAAAVIDHEARSIAESYEKFGRKDPRWDDSVREAVRHSAGRAPREAVLAAYKKAVDAGCDDPLVLYMYARGEWLAGPADPAAVLERHADAAIALAKTQYPAEWKCRAAARYVEQTRAPHTALIKICRDTFPAAIAETRRPKQDVRAFADMVYHSIKVTDDPRAAFDLVFDAYVKGRPDDSGPYAMKGERHLDYAWEARGSGAAATVGEDAWPVFQQHLAAARAALEKAWQLDPSDARGPTLMIGVAMGEGAPRREMETWFGRAMQANPDNRLACSRKLYSLYPRWGGSHAQMVAFGRECMATQNYWGPLPEILYDAHLQVAKERPDSQEYLASPAVWADIEAVHRTFVDAFPDSFKIPFYRSRLAKLACESGQWDPAAELFDEIGDKPDLGVFRSAAVYNYYRKKAQKRANNVRQTTIENPLR